VWYMCFIKSRTYAGKYAKTYSDHWQSYTEYSGTWKNM
jgi:hypothetical protein